MNEHAAGEAATDEGTARATEPSISCVLLHQSPLPLETSSAKVDLLRSRSNWTTSACLLPVAAETAEAVYPVVDAAYERRSIARSSNLRPAGFDELMPKTIANATVDRLLHLAHVVLTAGDPIGSPKPRPARG